MGFENELIIEATNLAIFHQKLAIFFFDTPGHTVERVCVNVSLCERGRWHLGERIKSENYLPRQIMFKDKDKNWIDRQR